MDTEMLDRVRAAAVRRDAATEAADRAAAALSQAREARRAAVADLAVELVQARATGVGLRALAATAGLTPGRVCQVTGPQESRS